MVIVFGSAEFFHLHWFSHPHLIPKAGTLGVFFAKGAMGFSSMVIHNLSAFSHICSMFMFVFPRQVGILQVRFPWKRIGPVVQPMVIDHCPM